MGRRIEARKGDNPAGSKPSSRCVEANDGLWVLTKRNPTALISTDHQMVINGNYRPGPMLSSHKTRDAIHVNFSVTRKCHVSCHEGGVSRLASNTTKSILLSPPPRLPSTLPRGAAVSFRVLRPAYRGFVGTTRRASPSSSLSRVRFTPRRRARRIRSARRGAHRFIRGRLLRRDARRPHLDDRPRRSAIGTGKRTRGIDDAQRRGVAPSGPPIRKPRRRPVISPGAAKRR
jgi:hypothetical protein